MYSDNPEHFTSVLKEKVTKHKPDYVLLRDKSTSSYEQLAQQFISTCEELGSIKSFIHQKVDLAKALGAVGVHLTSLQFGEIEYAKSLGLEVIVSTHTHQEVLEAEVLGATAVTYSPIFYSPNKGEPKGVEDLQEVITLTKVNIFALGGIVDEQQIKVIEEVKPYGFASIRYFY